MGKPKSIMDIDSDLVGWRINDLPKLDKVGLPVSSMKEILEEDRKPM